MHSCEITWYHFNCYCLFDNHSHGTQTWIPLSNHQRIQKIDAIRMGVELFDLKLSTCLLTDWLKQGIGYYMCYRSTVYAPAEFQIAAPVIGVSQ